MPTWNSRGLRGSFLEELVNMTNEKYQTQNLALVQKIPTPIKPINIDQETRHITLAYFEQKSTVDYIGVVQGIPICFDAKECIEDRFPLSNVHEHQMKFMEQFESQDGIAFLLIYFKNREKYMYLRFQKLLEFWKRMEQGGRKSFTIDEMEDVYKRQFINCSVDDCFVEHGSPEELYARYEMDENWLARQINEALERK